MCGTREGLDGGRQGGRCGGNVRGRYFTRAPAHALSHTHAPAPHSGQALDKLEAKYPIKGCSDRDRRPGGRRTGATPVSEEGRELRDRDDLQNKHSTRAPQCQYSEGSESRASRSHCSQVAGAGAFRVTVLGRLRCKDCRRRRCETAPVGVGAGKRRRWPLQVFKWLPKIGRHWNAT